jgi:hypothetical protein
MVIMMPRPKKYPDGVVIISISVRPKVREEFDKRKGKRSRGEYLEWLLEVTRPLEQKT